MTRSPTGPTPRARPPTSTSTRPPGRGRGRARRRGGASWGHATSAVVPSHGLAYGAGYGEPGAPRPHLSRRCDEPDRGDPTRRRGGDRLLRLVVPALGVHQDAV